MTAPVTVPAAWSTTATGEPPGAMSVLLPGTLKPLTVRLVPGGVSRSLSTLPLAGVPGAVACATGLVTSGAAACMNAQQEATDKHRAVPCHVCARAFSALSCTHEHLVRRPHTYTPTWHVMRHCFSTAASGTESGMTRHVVWCSSCRQCPQLDTQ